MMPSHVLQRTSGGYNGRSDACVTEIGMKAGSSKPRAKAAKRAVMRSAAAARKSTPAAAPPAKRALAVAGKTGRASTGAVASQSDEIVALAENLAGSKAKARDWFRTYPIPAFGGVTAEFLVDHGRAKEVREYLNAVVLGEFA